MLRPDSTGSGADHPHIRAARGRHEQIRGDEGCPYPTLSPGSTVNTRAIWLSIPRAGTSGNGCGVAASGGIPYNAIPTRTMSHSAMPCIVAPLFAAWARAGRIPSRSSAATMHANRARLFVHEWIVGLVGSGEVRGNSFHNVPPRSTISARTNADASAATTPYRPRPVSTFTCTRGGGSTRYARRFREGVRLREAVRPSG